MQNRRFMGMTIAQLGILAGLGCVACILCSVAGTAFLGNAPSLVPQPPESTPVQLPTSTIPVIPTITPTAVPSPVPYEQLIPEGWTQHQTALVELWLPPGFKNAGPNAAPVISGNSVVLEMELTATVSSSSVYRVIASVAYEPLTADSLDAYVEARLSAIPPEVNLAERRKVIVNGAEAYRLVFESRANSINVNDLMYVFQDGGTVWYVRYSAQINEFYEMLDVFEASARTFRVAQ